MFAFILNRELTHDTAVSRGVELLDEKVPDWRGSVDIERLDIANTHDCILGQVFGDYHVGMDVLFPGTIMPGGIHNFPARVSSSESHGFEAMYATNPDDDDYAERDYEGLHEAWGKVFI